MPQPTATRDRILDAFEGLLAEHGEPGATIDAVAARAEVSKGGLLYHFASKEALIAGLMARLDARVEQDLARMATAPQGPVDYIIRTAVEADSGLLRTVFAAATLAQGPHDTAREHLRAMQAGALEVLRRSVADPTVSRVIALIGDGLYFNSALRLFEDPGDAELERIIRVARSLASGV